MIFGEFAKKIIKIYNASITSEDIKKGEVDQQDKNMFNMVVLIGRTVSDIKLHTLESGFKVGFMTLAVNRPFKNMNTGEPDTDFITVVLWAGIAETASQYCHKGSTVAVKGRVAVRKKDVNGKSVDTIEIIGERVSFINLKTQEAEVEFFDNANQI